MKKYITKKVEIEAVQYTGDNIDELRAFVPEEWRDNRIWRPLAIKTLEGSLEISVGDFVIKGLKGEFYPCKPDVFHLKYELLNEQKT